MSGAGQAGQPGQAAMLAAGAAGLVSAVLALWAMRGLPFGALLLWLAPLPLFAAASGFGPRVAWGAAGIGALAVAIGSNSLGAALYLGAFALPAALIAATAFPGGAPAGRLDLSTPLALLGLWPTLVLALVALMVSDLEGAMREAVSQGVRRMGVPLAEEMIEQIARVKAAAVGFWTALLMLGNGLAGQRLMERQGLALAPLPEADDLRLPGWYAPLPLLALAAWAAFGGVLTISALLILLIPFFLLGVVGVHRRLRGRAGRLAFLAGFYLLMLLFLQIMAPLLVGVGLFDQFRRRAAPSNPT
ncbi:hypothetical protein [Rubritepida flocculans]|uniref:hypothetical protein n=1 Tax=Rubritepida flocculans TaxID=182403 RepID=UPI0012EB627E|nr:hypothetical protein [Rubritepida flocculans]